MSKTEIKNNLENFIINSRIRLLRNVTRFPFVSKLNADRKKRMEIEFLDFFKTLGKKIKVFKTNGFSNTEILYYKERLLEKEVFFSNDNIFFHHEKQDFFIILNTSEHLKFISDNCNSGFKETIKNIYNMESFIGNTYKYCISPNYGYLTEKLKNCGLGLKLSVLIHLPGISLLNLKVFDDLYEKGYTVTKWRKDSPDNYYYILSTRLNFGVSESEIVERFEQGIESLAEIEKTQLFEYNDKNNSLVDDIISRSYGILKHVKVLKYEELVSYLSNLLIGIELGYEKNISKKDVFGLLLSMQEGNLLKNISNDNDENLSQSYDADYLRAEKVKVVLNLH